MPDPVSTPIFSIVVLSILAAVGGYLLGRYGISSLLNKLWIPHREPTVHPEWVEKGAASPDYFHKDPDVHVIGSEKDKV